MSVSVCCLEALPRDLMTTTKYNNLSPLHIYMPRNGSAIELIATFRFRFGFGFCFGSSMMSIEWRPIMMASPAADLQKM